MTIGCTWAFMSLCMGYERCSTDTVVLYVGGEVTCHRNTIIPGAKEL